MTLIRLLIAIPVFLLLVVLALFALSNEETVHLLFWPTDFDVPLPLSVAILVAAALAFLAGALMVWLGVLSSRLRARRAEKRVRLLEEQLAQLRRELGTRASAAGDLVTVAR